MINPISVADQALLGDLEKAITALETDEHNSEACMAHGTLAHGVLMLLRIEKYRLRTNAQLIAVPQPPGVLGKWIAAGGAGALTPICILIFVIGRSKGWW